MGMQGRLAMGQEGTVSGAADGLLLERVGVRGVLDGISFTASRGGLLSILGGPGSGKSTLFSVLAGFTAITAGKASWAGADLRRTRPDRRGFGIVAQEDALFPRLSLAENIAYPLRLRRVKRRDRARMVDAALESVLLENPFRLPAQATRAERQRAWIARATIFGPSVLLLDEPLAHQDQEQRGTVLAALRRLHLLLGTTTILTTRVPGDALALGDHLAILDRGQIVQSGAPETIYERPGTAIAALACGEANLLPGVVRAIDEDGIARVGLRCGPVAEGAAGSGLRVRDHCVVCLRPERIAVAPTRAAEMGEAALDTTVLEALNLGDTVRLRLLLGAGQEVLVKRPAAAGLRGMRAGQNVAIAWQPANAVVFPAGQ
jgi:putative spermidine/putrescine transport system ATP-binding protein